VFFAAAPVFADTIPPIDDIKAERSLGAADAPVTFVEYASLTCPHCAAFARDTLPDLKKEYVDTGKVKLVFRDYPLDQLALTAAMMARCAPKERYFGLIESIFDTQLTWARAQDPKAALSRIGKLAGMSQETIDACTASKDVYNAVMATRGEGDKQKVDATPTFFINDKKMSGELPIDELRKVIDPIVAAAKK
jgi:protein-disulfide isomerase